MKPVYLEFCGVNSFSEKTEIDFNALISGGVFGIFGDTGSGKSTLLDCIHLALYGRTERSGNSGDYINYKSEGSYVTFDFEITTEGKRHAYRVHRERRRKNNTTKAALYERDEEGKLLALAEGTRDVDDALEKIIGLTFADFKMCIALPQGDFAALVQAPQSERVRLVSRLFDLEKYGERFSKAANEKYYAAEREVNLVKAKMEQYEEGETTLEDKESQIKAEKKALAEAEKIANEAEQAFVEQLTLQEVQLLAVFMKNEWLKRALYTWSLIRQEYSTKDFQLTSQANHMDKLKQLVELSDYECKHMINLYSRVIEHKPVNWTAKFAGGNNGK